MVLFFAIRLIMSVLYGVSTFDPVALIAIAILQAVATIIAGIVPALRATSVDPIQALRVE